jgi:hypothetical protein
MFRFLKRNDSEVITPEVVDVPVMTTQSNIAMALALCMEEYLRSVSKTSVDIPNRDTLIREYNTLVDAVKIGRNELFVACPPGQLNNPEVTITKKAVDLIVYQPCAYGVLIHSMWGEESEDKVFEEYKRINNLML